MEKTIDFTELSDTELIEISGGSFPMLLIKMFGPDIAGLMAFWDGLRDGYVRTTQ
jgi:bacteriocin-like protein